MAPPAVSAMATVASPAPPLSLDLRSFHQVRFLAAVVAAAAFAVLAFAWEWDAAWVVSGLAAVDVVHAALRVRRLRPLWGTLLLDIVIVCTALAFFRPPPIALITAIIYLVTAPLLLTSGRTATILVATGVVATTFAAGSAVFWPATIEWTPLRTGLVTLAVMAVFVPLIIWMLRRTAEQTDERERIRAELEEARRRQAEILDNAPVGMEITASVDNSQFVAVNEAFCRFLGYTQDELLRLGVTDVVHPEDLAATSDVTSALVRGELDRFEMERRYIRADGRIVWANFGLSVVKDADGKPKYSIGQVQDITAKKELELERDLLLNLSLAVANAEDPQAAMRSVLAGLGTAGRWSIGVLWVPSGGGMERAHIWAAYPAVDRWADTTTRLEAGQGLVGAVVTARSPIAVPSLAKDPHFLAAEYANSLGLDVALGVPVLAGDGIVGMLLFLGTPDVDPMAALDTTQAVVAHLGQAIAVKLAEAERDRLATILEHTTDVVGMADLEGRVLYLNPASRDLLGLSPSEEVNGLTIRAFHPPEVADRILNEALPLVLEHGSWRGETTFLTRDGREVPTSQVILAHRNDRGETLYFSTIARDITPHVRLAEQQAEAIRSKDEFIASVSHEIRTPLTAVRGFSEILASPHAGLTDDERHEMISSIASEAADVADIVEDLLVAARSDIDQLTISPRRVDIGPVVAETAERIRWEDKPVKREVPDGLMVRADPLRLRQILRNLMVNAVRYGGDHVLLRARREGEEILIEVLDDGEGISEQYREEIFAPYRRAHDRPGLAGSVGLGLSVSRRLARLMGGDITYTHSAGWSTFTLRLPAAL